VGYRGEPFARNSGRYRSCKWLLGKVAYGIRARACAREDLNNYEARRQATPKNATRTSEQTRKGGSVERAHSSSKAGATDHPQQIPEIERHEDYNKKLNR
jgi:hypothetical protein